MAKTQLGCVTFLLLFVGGLQAADFSQVEHARHNSHLQLWLEPAEKIASDSSNTLARRDTRQFRERVLLVKAGANDDLIPLAPSLRQDSIAVLMLDPTTATGVWKKNYIHATPITLNVRNRIPLIVIRTNGQFSEEWRGLQLLHALRYLLEGEWLPLPRNREQQNLRSSLLDAEAYSHTYTLLVSLKGESYKKFLAKRFERVRRETESVSPPPTIEEGNRWEEQKLLGAALSEEEAGVREMTCLIHGLFQQIDEDARHNRTQPDDVKVEKAMTLHVLINSLSGKSEKFRRRQNI